MPLPCTAAEGKQLFLTAQMKTAGSWLMNEVSCLSSYAPYLWASASTGSTATYHIAAARDGPMSFTKSKNIGCVLREEGRARATLAAGGQQSWEPQRSEGGNGKRPLRLTSPHSTHDSIKGILVLSWVGHSRTSAGQLTGESIQTCVTPIAPSEVSDA